MTVRDRFDAALIDRPSGTGSGEASVRPPDPVATASRARVEPPTVPMPRGAGRERGHAPSRRLRRGFERRCLEDDSVRCAVLLTPDAADGGLRPKAVWPVGSVPPPSLLQAAVAATRSRAPLVTLLDERRPDGPRLLSMRIEDPQRLLGVVAVLLDGPPIAVARHLATWLALRAVGGETVVSRGDVPAGLPAPPVPAPARPIAPALRREGEASGGDAGRRRDPAPEAAPDGAVATDRGRSTVAGLGPRRSEGAATATRPRVAAAARVGDPAAPPAGVAVGRRDAPADARQDAPPDAPRGAVPEAPNRAGRDAESVSILECQAAIADAADLDAAVRGLLAVIARQYGCRRLAFGWWRPAGTQVAALSDSAGGPPSSEVAAPLATAMDEAIDQQACVAWPAPEALASVHVPVAQAQAARFGHVAVVCSVPLFAGGRPVGAMVLERDDHRFDAADLDALGRLAAFVAPMLLLRRQAARPLRTFASALRERLFGSGRRLGWGIVFAGLAGVAALLLPVTDRVSAPSRVEGETQRALTAPVDGWLMKVHVRPGDRVGADQLLVELDDRDLELERLRWHTETEQAERQATEALAREDRGQYAVHAAKASQARSQRALVEAQLARQRVRAPFDGIVLSGDLTQSLGAPVRAGETLLTIAPGDRHRVIVDVDERDVARVALGARGELALSAGAGRRVPVEVVRIAPAAVVREGRTVFEIEARPLVQADLRPGYQGVAKFDAPPRTLAAVMFERPWRTLADRLWAIGW